MCLDRKHLSNEMLIERIKLAQNIANDRLIIQADGIPMSGGVDDFNTTLQAVSIADFINKEIKQKEKKFSKLPVLISGGTNSFTGELARNCEVPYNGITIGTHARKVIKEFESKPNEMSHEELLMAISKANKLINRNLKS